MLQAGIRVMFESISTNRMNVECKICDSKIARHRTTTLMINHLQIEHKEKTYQISGNVSLSH